MQKKVRFDRSRLDNIQRTPQGFVKAPAFVTRVGVLKYTMPDGTVKREFRPPEEVFKADSMASLANIPFTNDHPNRLIDTLTARQHMVGFTGDSVEKVDDTFLKTMVTITCGETIDHIESGKVEVSCGYEAELEETPGVYNGEHYDSIQRNIIYNHVSLVTKGRAGRDVRLRLDSDGHAVLEDQVEKILIDGKEFEVSSEVAAAFKAHLAKVESDRGELETLKPKVVDAEKAIADSKAEADQLQAKVDSLTEDLKARTDSAAPAESVIQARVKERIKLERVAAQILAADAKVDEMNNLDLMKNVIKARTDKADLDGKSEAYVQARFDHIAETLDLSVDAARSFGASRLDSSTAPIPDSKAAREKMIQESLSAYKQPTTASKN